MCVNHQVAVVSVLDLQNVAENVVCGKRCDEVVLRLSKFSAVFFAKRLDEVSQERALQGFANVMPRLAVRNALDDAVLSKDTNYLCMHNRPLLLVT